MAQITLQQPEQFNFRNPDDWSRWKRRFQQFREASGLSEASASKQISTLLYCLGEEAEAVLTSTNATTEDRADYKRVLEKFDSFFQVRKNIIYERARFNRRNQNIGETAEQYIMALYELAEHCEYGGMKEEMIRDRLVVGIRDTTLSEKLQLDSALTLESAKKAIRQREAVHEQQQSLKGDDKTSGADSNLDAIGHKKNIGARNPHRGQRRDSTHGNTGKQPRTPTTRTRDKCGRCGREKHPRDKCPAREAQCHNCQRKGHYSVMCYQRTISAVLEEPDTAFLDTISDSEQKGWTSVLTINGKQIPFKLDTGAEVTAISMKTWKEIGEPALQLSYKHLFGPAQQQLVVKGHFNCQFSHKDKEAQQQVFVVDNLKTNLIGLPAIIALNLVARTDTIQTKPTESSTWQERFPKVFQGLGTLAGEYEILLCPDAQPHAIFTPRHIPLPLCPQVEEELKRMEKAGVISRVSEPTEWCVGIEK